jgi:NAD-dependent SIR2 family protein deacetylase
MRRAPLIAFHNKSEIDFCQECGCYHCLKVFPKEEIKKWTDNSKTALCPHCGVDAVLPNTAYSLTEEVLKPIYEYWFKENKADEKIKNKLL